MPRQQRAETLHVLAGRDLIAPEDMDEDIDYDADYRALDLMPGAPLRDIEDRARLLRAAFHPERLPAGLKARTETRSQMIDRAVDELSRYWKTHGAPPPTAAMRSAQAGDLPPAGLLAALADALGTGADEMLDGASVEHGTWPVAPVRASSAGFPLRQIGDPVQTTAISGDREGTGSESSNAGFSELSPSGVPWFRVRGPHSRLGMTSLQPREVPDLWVAVLHLYVSGQPAPPPPSKLLMAARQGPPFEDMRQYLPTSVPDFTYRPQPMIQVAQRLTGAATEPNAPDPGDEPIGGRQNRQHRSIARPMVLRLAIVGLVIAAAALLMQYRADHVVLGASAEPYSAIATGLPGDPPARWSGLSPPHQPTGAAAPSIARQR